MNKPMGNKTTKRRMNPSHYVALWRVALTDVQPCIVGQDCTGTVILASQEPCPGLRTSPVRF
jgi:hypothetical protein